MKIKFTKFLIGLLATYFLFIPPHVIAANPVIKQFPIFYGEGQQIIDGDNPVSDGKIAFTDIAGANTNLYVVDLNTGIDTLIYGDSTVRSRPSIDGENVVWIDNRNGEEDVYLYNLTSKLETRITQGVNADYLSISGDYIVWSEYYNGYDVWMYQISNAQTTRLTDTVNDSEGNIVIEDDNIFWKGIVNGQWEIFYYQISTGQTTQLTTSTTPKYDLAIDEGVLFWSEAVDSVNIVNSYDTVQQSFQEVVNNWQGNIYDLKVKDNMVTWWDYYGSSIQDKEIFFVNLNEGTIRYLVNPGNDQENPYPYFFENAYYIFWNDSRDYATYQTDIYSASVIYPSKEPKKVYRFWSDTKQKHFYTINESEKNYIIANYPARVWRYEGSVFSAFGSQEEETVPVYRFWSDTKQGHFYTSNEAEKNYVMTHYTRSVWKYEGVAFYAYSSTMKNSGIAKPVYRFWSDSKQAHFYTASESEKNYVISRYSKVWKYETVAYYLPL